MMTFFYIALVLLCLASAPACLVVCLLSLRETREIKRDIERLHGELWSEDDPDPGEGMSVDHVGAVVVPFSIERRVA